MNPPTQAELLSNRQKNLAFARMMLQRCMRKAAGFRSDLTIKTVAQNSTLVVNVNNDGPFLIVVGALDTRVDYWGVSHQNPDTQVVGHFVADNRCTLQRKLRRCARAIFANKPPGPKPTPEFERNLVMLRCLLRTYSVSPQDARIYPSSLDKLWIHHRTNSRRREDHQLIVGHIALEDFIHNFSMRRQLQAQPPVRIAVPMLDHTAYYLIVDADTASRKRKRNGAGTVTITRL